MNKRIILVLAALFAVTALAGCHSQEHSREQGAGETADDTGLDIEPDDEVTAIRIIDAPPVATPREDLSVCWEVDGVGTAEHTALYFDNESHADEAFGPFGADVIDHYELGFAFPNNTEETAEDGYPIGMVYCADVPMIEATLYLRAYVIVDEPPGELSEEEEVMASSEFAIEPEPGPEE